MEYSGATSTQFLEDVILDENVSEGTCRLVGMLLELECSSVWAVGHLLSIAITMDCNIKLIRRGALLPSVLATEATA